MIEKNILYIWCDGACSGNPGPGGYAAAIIHNDNIEFRSGYSEYTTNNRMELAGFIEALTMAINGLYIIKSHMSTFSD